MQAERLRVLDDAYVAWNAADFEHWSTLWDEDVVYDVSAIFWDQGPIQGREQLVKFGTAVLRTWERLRMELLETIETGDERIVQRVRLRATARHTGVDVDRVMLQVFEYAGGARPVRGSLHPE